MKRSLNIDMNESIEGLCEAFLHLKTKDEIYSFLKDLCTPQELTALAERWRVCQLLHQGNLSYRDINQLTGASLMTIGRVARFLKDEPYKGYQNLLGKMKRSPTDE